MERYIGVDVHAASCTLAVASQTGKRLKDFPVETNGQAKARPGESTRRQSFEQTVAKSVRMPRYAWPRR